jgi:hypothetical protein
MTTVESFNSTLKSFLVELVEVFPDEPGIGKVELFLATFDTVTKANPKMALTMFLDTMSPHADCISTKDESLFSKVEMPGGISLEPLWKKATPNTKECVWQYLQMLFLLATTANAVPDDMLNKIESMAAEYAEKIQSGEMDMTQLAGMLMGGQGLDLEKMLGDK